MTLTRDARLQIVLIDFGASREYRREFVDDYIHVIHGAAVNDRAQVLDYSTRLGFLTGYESKVSDVIHARRSTTERRCSTTRRASAS